MTWNETDKDAARWVRIKGAVGKVRRGAFGRFDTRGEISKEIHGTTGVKVTRKDIRNRFGAKLGNNFTETDKSSSDWSKIE